VQPCSSKLAYTFLVIQCCCLLHSRRRQIYPTQRLQMIIPTSRPGRTVQQLLLSAYQHEHHGQHCIRPINSAVGRTAA
jgi:hypothetical protein